MIYLYLFLSCMISRTFQVFYLSNPSISMLIDRKFSNKGQLFQIIYIFAFFKVLQELFGHALYVLFVFLGNCYFCLCTLIKNWRRNRYPENYALLQARMTLNELVSHRSIVHLKNAVKEPAGLHVVLSPNPD